MILILGSDTFEQGTNPVIDWLIYYKAHFLKITEADFFSKKNSLNININSKKVYYKGYCLNDEVSVIWYRHFKQRRDIFVDTEHEFSRQINSELNTEIETLTEYLYETLKDKKWYSPLPYININKLSMLNKAKEVGLKIPNSKILTTKEGVYVFMSETSFRKKIIKQFSDKSRGYFINGNDTYFSLAKEFKESDLKEIPESFMPTLFQEKIQTKYEVRVFYIEEQFFATAILSNFYDQIDDRKKITDNENIHFVPYELPQKVKNNIITLMKNQGLITGALDLIKDIHGDYYFLEINPIGQYLFESNKCNFHIAKKIAEHLIRQDEIVIS